MTRCHGMRREFGVALTPFRPIARGVAIRPDLPLRRNSQRARAECAVPPHRSRRMRVGMRCFGCRFSRYSLSLSRFRLLATGWCDGSNRQTIVNSLIAAIGAIRVAALIAARERNAHRRNKGNGAFQQVAGGVGHRVKDQCERKSRPNRT